MILKGRVEKAELKAIGQLDETALVVTLIAGGNTFVFPLAPEQGSSLRIGNTMIFEVDAMPAINGFKTKAAVLTPETELIRPLTPREQKRRGSIRTKVTDVKGDTDQVDKPKTMTDSEIKKMYGIKAQANNVPLVPSIETNPESVTLDDFKHATGIPESVQEDEKEPEIAVVRPNMTINTDTEPKGEYEQRADEAAPNAGETKDEPASVADAFQSFSSGGFTPFVTEETSTDDEDEDE